MAIAKGYRTNFDTMLRAAKDGQLALVECRDAKTNELRVVICAVQRGDDGEISMVPFGHLCNGNPYEEYLPPA